MEAWIVISSKKIKGHGYVILLGEYEVKKSTSMFYVNLEKPILTITSPRNILFRTIGK